LNYFLYKKIYDYLQNLILKEEDAIDDILLENLKKIRKPIHFVIIFIGLKLALEVLVYPVGLNENISNTFFLFFILAIAYIVFVIIDNFLFVYLVQKEVKNEIIRKELIMLMISVLKIIIFLVAFLLFLVKLNINISGILASLGIGGLAIALAAQTTLSNFFGLVKMISDKSFSQGDWIQTKDIEGTVIEVGFISTKIRTFDNALITIPNSTLANTPIKNWNKRVVGRRIKMHIGLTYSSNMQDVKNAIQDITTMLKNHKNIATADKIDYKSSISNDYKKEQRLLSIDDKYGIKSTLLVYLDKMSDSSIDILVYAFTNTVEWQEWLEVKEDILFQIWDIVEKNNLEFAFPSQSIYIEEKMQN
jgi:MscS family membrane protein